MLKATTTTLSRMPSCMLKSNLSQRSTNFAKTVSATAETQVRQQSSRKNNMGRFHFETYINGSRLSPYWVDHKQSSKFNNLDLLAMDTVPASSDSEVTLPTDTSATVSITAPDSYAEDKVTAGKLGVLHFFHKRSGDSSSAIAVSFSAEHAELEMDRVTQMTKFNFWSSNPYGVVSDVKLAASAVSHLKKNKNFQVACMLFDTKGIEPRVGQMMMLLKTPAGVWKVSWHSTMEDIYANKLFFVHQVIQNIKVTLKKSSKKPVGVTPALPASELITPIATETLIPTSTVLQAELATTPVSHNSSLDTEVPPESS